MRLYILRLKHPRKLVARLLGFKNSNGVGRLLSGDREITAEHIDRLINALRAPPEHRKSLAVADFFAELQGLIFELASGAVKKADLDALIKQAGRPGRHPKPPIQTLPPGEWIGGIERRQRDRRALLEQAIKESEREGDSTDRRESKKSRKE